MKVIPRLDVSKVRETKKKERKKTHTRTAFYDSVPSAQVVMSIAFD